MTRVLVVGLDAVGHARVATPVACLGNDDASHANAGFLAMAGPGVEAAGRYLALDLLDVAPTILHLLQVDVPAALRGRALHVGEEVYGDDEQLALTNRLSALYLQ